MAAGHPYFARLYRRVIPVLDRAGLDAWRRDLLANVSGRVLEIGAGAGSNFAHYPPAVSQLVALEPESVLRNAAWTRARDAAIPVQIVAGRAERLPFKAASFDAVVSTLVLCSVEDLAAVLAEIKRVLTPRGSFHLFEHVQSDKRSGQILQSVLDATLWPRCFGGCHTGRDIATALDDAGFTSDGIRRVRVPERGLATPVSPHIFGTALKT